MAENGAVNEAFEMMSDLVRRQWSDALTAFLQRDDELAAAVVLGDDAVNAAVPVLAHQAQKSLAAAGSDVTQFRMVLTRLQGAGVLERIGDHAVTLAEAAQALTTFPSLVSVDELIKRMGGSLQEMLAQLLTAYRQADVPLAETVAQGDTAIERDCHRLRKYLIDLAASAPNQAQAVSRYLQVVRLLQRVGDLLVSLAEWLVYQQSGEVVERHWPTAPAQPRADA